MVGGTMPRSTPAELRENSRSARQMAVKEADPYFKRMWASHALALDQLAEKIERGEGAAHKAGDTMPADENLLRPIDRVRPSSTKTMAEGGVLRERREPSEVTLLKQRLEHLQTAFRMLEASERERETQVHRRLDDAASGHAWPRPAPALDGPDGHARSARTGSAANPIAGPGAGTDRGSAPWTRLGVGNGCGAARFRRYQPAVVSFPR